MMLNCLSTPLTYKGTHHSKPLLNTKLKRNSIGPALWGSKLWSLLQVTLWWREMTGSYLCLGFIKNTELVKLVITSFCLVRQIQVNTLWNSLEISTWISLQLHILFDPKLNTYFPFLHLTTKSKYLIVYFYFIFGYELSLRFLYQYMTLTPKRQSYNTLSDDLPTNERLWLSWYAEGKESFSQTLNF